jgi:hypothetical protein
MEILRRCDPKSADDDRAVGEQRLVDLSLHIGQCGRSFTGFWRYLDVENRERRSIALQRLDPHRQLLLSQRTGRGL